MIAVLAAIVMGQGSDIPVPPSGFQTDSWSIDLHDANGAKIGSCSSKCRAVFSVLPGPTDRAYWLEDCGNYCKGRQHKVHAQCDFSCDVRCEYKHDHRIDSEVEVNDDGLAAFANPDEAAFLKGLGKSLLGSTSKSVARSLANKVIEPWYRIRREIKCDHFANPCSEADRYYTGRSYDIFMNADISTTMVVNGVTTTSDRKTTQKVARAWVVDPSDYETKQYLFCHCDQSNNSPTWDEDDWFYGETKLGAPYQLDTFTGGLDGIEPTEPLDAGGFYYVPGGTRFVSNDEAYQILIALWGQKVNLASNGHVRMPEIAEKISVACTEMTKRMPDGLKFTMKPPQDENLTHLARLGKDEIIRGLYDQPRIWIYTDKASLDEINKHLLPRTTASIYLRGLWEVAHAHALDLSDSSYAHLVEPKLITGLTAPKKAKFWLIQTLDRLDPKGLVKAIQGLAGEFTALIKSPADVTGMADLLDALSMSATPEVQQNLEAFIAKAVPEGRRAEILGKTKYLKPG